MNFTPKRAVYSGFEHMMMTTTTTTTMMMMMMMMMMVADPVPVLEHAQQLQKKAHRAHDLEVENQQLRGRLDEYDNEFAEVKNQGLLLDAP